MRIKGFAHKSDISITYYNVTFMWLVTYFGIIKDVSMKLTKNVRSILAVLVLVGISYAGAAESEGVRIAKALSSAYAEIAQKVSPSVVAIETTKKLDDPEEAMKKLPFNLPPQMRDMLKEKLKSRKGREIPQGMGSGIIVDSKGVILTNNHVVADASKIKVTLQTGKVYEAEIVGTDPKSDVAVIKISKPDVEFEAAKLGDSEKVKVGNLVLAIGAPFGLKQSVTCGIVSAMNRQRLGGGQLKDLMYQDFIQTDATINPGNSGGPLVNLDGEVVGINSIISTASRGSDGVGFAIPVNMAREIMTELIASGSVTRGWLGVSISDFTPEMGKAVPGVDSGVMVMQVFPGTPAFKGGLKFGDIMLSYNGTKLKDATHLQNLVAHTKVGATAKIKVMRGQNSIVLNVPIGRQPKRLAMRGGELEKEKVEKEAEKVDVYTSELLGLKVVDLKDAPEDDQELYKGFKGVVVSDVVAGSAADEAGIVKGALIMLVNLAKTESVEEFKKAEQMLKGKGAALMHLRFGKVPNVVTVKLDKGK